MKFRKKPIVIEAILWEGDNTDEFDDFAPEAKIKCEGMRNALVIETLEGTMLAEPGDWIIRGIANELYPCKPEIFAATYEPVEYPSSPQVTPEPNRYIRTGLDEPEHAPIRKSIEAVVKRVEDEQSRCAYPGCGKPRHYVRHKVSLSTTGPASLEMHRFVGSKVKPRTGDKS